MSPKFLEEFMKHCETCKHKTDIYPCIICLDEMNFFFKEGQKPKYYQKEELK